MELDKVDGSLTKALPDSSHIKVHHAARTLRRIKRGYKNNMHVASAQAGAAVT